MIPALLVALRPRQWIKNLLVFAAPLFAFVTDPDELLRVVGAFFAFCAVSSAVYLLNDWFDLEQDRLHPIKQRRPLASGQISLSATILVAILLSIAGLGLAAKARRAGCHQSLRRVGGHARPRCARHGCPARDGFISHLDVSSRIGLECFGIER